jgi:hypothetical protein
MGGGGEGGGVTDPLKNIPVFRVSDGAKTSSLMYIYVYSLYRVAKQQLHKIQSLESV